MRQDARGAACGWPLGAHRYRNNICIDAGVTWARTSPAAVFQAVVVRTSDSCLMLRDKVSHVTQLSLRESGSFRPKADMLGNVDIIRKKAMKFFSHFYIGVRYAHPVLYT
jgi:hypothetical protein